MKRIVIALTVLALAVWPTLCPRRALVAVGQTAPNMRPGDRLDALTATSAECFAIGGREWQTDGGVCRGVDF